MNRTIFLLSEFLKKARRRTVKNGEDSIADNVQTRRSRVPEARFEFRIRIQMVAEVYMYQLRGNDG